MELIDVVRKLTGPIDPIGETNADEERFENLITTLSIVESLLKDIYDVSQNKNCRAHSMKKAGMYAQKFLNETSRNYQPDSEE